MTSSSATTSTLSGLTGGPKATPDDILLASVASTGSVGAFETLVERYSRRVYALIVRIVGSGADAEELTQDVMMRVFDRAAAFDGRSAVGTWIFRIAYNMAIDHTRREQRRADRAQGNEQSDILADRAAESDADDPMVEVLEEALRTLPPSDRALITLYYYDGHPVAEIAEITHMSQSNVKVRLMRLRDRLRTAITTLSTSPSAL